MSATDGGPAFPAQWESPISGDPMQSLGMTLRDYFAGQALAGMFASEGVGPEGSTWGEIPDVAQHAYRMADAMLAERDK